MFGNNYRPEEYENGNMEEGDYRTKIIKVEDKTSRNGNPMREVDMKINEAKYTFKYYLVENEHFNANVTRFFDCFKIRRGDFDSRNWLGKIGMIHIAKGKARDNGKSYWEVQYLIVPTAQGQVPQQAQRQPAPQQAPRPQEEPFTDDIPF